MPICTICGQEVNFIHQYQQWYCSHCRTYPYLQQAAAPQQYYQPPAYSGYQTYYPQYQYQPTESRQPPVTGPDPAGARSRIYGSVMMRQGSDRTVSKSWVWIILLFQLMLPLSAVIAALALFMGMDFDINALGYMVLLLLIVLLISVALAISHAVLIYKLVKRRDDHFRRDSLLREGMTEHLGALSVKTGVDLNVERWTMSTLHYTGPNQERSAILWAILVALIPLIPIVGIIFLLYSQMFLTKDVQEHDERQRQFNHQYRMGLAKAGEPVNGALDWQPLPRRDVAVYMVLTVLTLGLFLPYWWYVNIVDMNMHFENQWKFENALLQRIHREG